MATTFRPVDSLATMPKIKPKKKAPCEKGRPTKSTRQQYPLEIKYKAGAWRTEDNMRLRDISRKLKAEYKLDIPPSTLSTWWNAENMNKFSNVAPDRINVQDVRYNPRQRPDVLVDMELILQRKFKAVAITVVPYTQ